jgi:hypothetical protein
MWFMPTYGRPHHLDQLVSSPGGLPPWDKFQVLLTLEDPKLCEYNCWPFEKHEISATSFGDVLRWILPHFPNESCYGLLTDDQVPMTPQWWEKLEAAAGSRYLATSTEPGVTAALPGAPCFGGDLVRAMNGILPIAGVHHNYSDVVWSMIGKDFGIIRVLPDVITHSNHPIYGTATMDATYERGAFNPVFKEGDPIAVHAWNQSAEKVQMYDRIRALLASPPR